MVWVLINSVFSPAEDATENMQIHFLQKPKILKKKSTGYVVKF